MTGSGTGNDDSGRQTSRDNPFEGQHGEEEDLDLTRIRTAYQDQSHAEDGPLGGSPTAGRRPQQIPSEQQTSNANPFAGSTDGTNNVDPGRLRAVSELHEEREERGPTDEPPSHAASGVNVMPNSQSGSTPDREDAVDPSHLRAVSEAHEEQLERGPSNEPPSQAGTGIVPVASSHEPVQNSSHGEIDTGRLRAISDLHSRRADPGPLGEAPAPVQPPKGITIRSPSQDVPTYDQSRQQSSTAATLVQMPTADRTASTTSTHKLSTEHHTLDKIRSARHDVEDAMRDKMKDLGQRFHLDSIKATGPSRLFNPTNIRMRVRFDEQPDESNIEKSKEVALLWRSRDNRKGRNSIAVPLGPSADPANRPRKTSSLVEVGKNLKRMCTTFPYWDMAFWSGMTYTIGSALFVLDGIFSWVPVAYPEAEFPGMDKYAGPIVFFVGACFYQVGAVMAYLEAVNDGSFHGSAMRRLLEGHEEDEKAMLDAKIHAFFDHLNPTHWHHKSDEEAQAELFQAKVDPSAGWRTKDGRMRPGSIYPHGVRPATRRGGMDMGGEEGDESVYMTWRWWPTWEQLKNHHVYEIGYIACAIQLFGVTLYGVTSVVVLPGILSSLAPWQKLAAFWVPQIVAALCFLIASLMFMFETQEKWWKPEPKVLGWWIGVWSVIGSVGFELIAIFGTMGLHEEEYPWAEYQADLSTIWGSAAYLTGSFLQWYEALNKNPVEELFNEPGEMKSSRVRV